MRVSDLVLGSGDLQLDPCLTCPPRGWTAEVVAAELDRLFREFPSAAHREVVGHSAENRAIESVRVGTGPTVVLAWSQMHGDEQTCTSVALNLLRVLMQNERPWAQQATQACTLHLIPMLNPDGAERCWRYNAIGVDINRDARALATPEGRVLHDRVQALRPAFAFNLHNQNRRRRLPSGEGPIAVSLLVPPLDSENTKTPSVLAAEQIAAEITRTIMPECNGCVTRYGADYMSRAFGEWVQSQGVSTVLLEAGGWREERNSPSAIANLERVNLLALAAGLVAIARGKERREDATAYTSLPRAQQHEAFDLLIERATVCLADATTAGMDLGINDDYPMTMPRPAGEGQVVDVGDLSVHRGLQRIDARGLWCLPGRTSVIKPSGDPESWLRDPVLEQALRRGITKLLLDIDLNQPDVAKWAAELARRPYPLINIALLDRGSCRSAPDGVALEVDAPLDARDWLASQSWNTRWPRSACDVVLTDPPHEPTGKIESAQTVIIGGSIVMQDGEIVERHAGRWLTHQTSP